MDNKDNIKIIKGAQEISDEELNYISGGASETIDGITYEYPDICPICGHNDMTSHWHQMAFDSTGTLRSIVCYRNHVQEFY